MSDKVGKVVGTVLGLGGGGGLAMVAVCHAGKDEERMRKG